MFQAGLELANVGIVSVFRDRDLAARLRRLRTLTGGGLRLGGKPGLHDTSVGETTRYVVNKAPCRVILTAPPHVEHSLASVPPKAAGVDPPNSGAAPARRGKQPAID